jgi:hypothetical protein
MRRFFATCVTFGVGFGAGVGSVLGDASGDGAANARAGVTVAFGSGGALGTGVVHRTGNA